MICPTREKQTKTKDKAKWEARLSLCLSLPFVPFIVVRRMVELLFRALLKLSHFYEHPRVRHLWLLFSRIYVFPPNYLLGIQSKKFVYHLIVSSKR